MPVNPSPHRFVPKRPTRRTPPREDPRPGSRHYQIHTSGPQHQTHPVPTPSASRPGPADQFAAAPRFAFGSRSRALLTAPAHTTAAANEADVGTPPRLVQGLRGKRAEDVEDSSSPQDGHGRLAPQHQRRYDDGDEMLEILPMTEHETSHPAHDTHPEPDTYRLPFSPKRRKTLHHDPPPTGPATSIPSFQRPPVPASQIAKPRFAPTRAPSPPPHPSASSRSAAHPPAFLRPSVHGSSNGGSTLEPAEPLPETFSPHRRRGKFVPGGMAATLQLWVLETGQAAVQSRRGQGELRGEDFVLRVTVEEVRGGGSGPAVATVVDSEGAARDVLFAPKGGVDERQVVLSNGAVVGVRAPVWDVQGDRGRQVTVAVDWKVLS